MAKQGSSGRSGQGADSVLPHLTQERAEISANNVRTHHAREAFTVLVVDDQPAMLYSTAKTLQHAGFRTLQTGSGTEALLMAKQASAVLLDVNLPDIHGIAVCRELKAAPDTAHLPVVLTSAVFVDELHKDAGLASGADAYLISPLMIEDLAATLDRLLGCRAAD